MNREPLVSVIIPTFNRADEVVQAVDSVLAQTYQRVQVIVVDDGSIDDTKLRLAMYGEKIELIAQSNAGPSAARNRGIAAAKGDLISFLDSDDIWLPEKLERQVLLLARANEASCCLSNILMRWKDREVTSFDCAGLMPPFDSGIWSNVDKILATRFVLFNQSIVIRRDVMEKIGPFDETLLLLEDHELALRLSLHRPWAFIREPLVVWRESVRGSLYQSAKKQELKWRIALVSILEAHLKRVADIPEQSELRHYVIRELKRARRHLRIAEMAQDPRSGILAWARLLDRVERYRKAISHRLPSFPEMSVQRVPDCL